MPEIDPQMSNQAFFDHVLSDDRAMFKVAEDTVNDFTRTKMREKGFARQILPPLPLGNDEIDRAVDTDKPVKIVDKEPGSPAALMVPFGTNPMGSYIRAPRYRVMFARIQTPKFTKDVSELRTYHMDVRQVISDNSIKDMLAEEDGKFIYAVNNILGAAESTNSITNTVQYKTYAAGVTRDSLAESLKILPSTPFNLEPATMLVNQVTIKDLLKFDRAEAGGELSQDMLLNGYTEKTLFGLRVIITLKKDLVPTNTVYYFAEPKYLGKFYTLEDATMFMEKRAYWIEFFTYSEIGGSIANVAGVARADFDVVGSSD